MPNGPPHTEPPHTEPPHTDASGGPTRGWQVRTQRPDELAEVMAIGWTGTTPTDTGWRLATLVPHSTTPLDLATPTADTPSPLSRPALRPWMGEIFNAAYVQPSERLTDLGFELPRINYGRCNERRYRFAWGVATSETGWPTSRWSASAVCFMPSKCEAFQARFILPERS